MLNNEFKSASLASPTTWFNYWFSDTVDPARLGGIADSIRIIRPDKNKPNKGLYNPDASHIKDE